MNQNAMVCNIVTDSFSRWQEIALMCSTLAGKTTELLRGYFATWSLPDELVSDNGPKFVSSECQTFLRSNGVKHIRSPAYHPASNGAAELLVQNFKRALEKGKNDNVSLQHCIHKHTRKAIFGVRCLTTSEVVVLRVEESAGHSLPPPAIPSTSSVPVAPMEETLQPPGNQEDS